MIASGFTWVFAVTAVGAQPCKPDAAGFCTAPVVRHALSYADADLNVKVNVALGRVTSVQLPPDVSLSGQPALGNRALFAFDSQPGLLLVWPKLPDERPDRLQPGDLVGQRTNLLIFFRFGVTVALELQIAPREQAVHRLVLTFPVREQESAYVQTALTEQAQQLRAAFEVEKAAFSKKVERRTQSMITEALLARLDCVDVSERSMRDFLIVWVRQLCRVGDFVFVRFMVRNRARDVFHLKDVRMFATGATTDGETAAVRFRGLTTLPFNRSIVGGALLRIIDTQADAYTLVVEEDGGKKRRVQVDGIAF